MKKIALILAVFLLLTLAFSACTPKTTPATESPTPTPAATVAPATAAPATGTPAEPAGPTEEQLKNSKPNEYVKEKLAAGQKVLIGCSMVADVPILMEVWAGEITKVIKPLGFDWVINAANGDTALMISQIENYAIMGAAAIIIVPPDKDTIKDAVLKAAEAGTYSIIFGVEGVDFCYSVRTQVLKYGAAQAKMAAAWAKMTFPDATAENPVKCASMYNSSVEDAKRNGQAATKTLNDDAICDILYEQDHASGSVDGGFNFAQDVLAFDPGIRVFLCSHGPDALGTSNYVLAQPGLDYAKYGVFCQNMDNACRDAITNLAPTNKAVLRGSAEQKESAGTSLATCTVNALFGEWKNPYEYVVPGSSFVQPGWDYTDSWA